MRFAHIIGGRDRQSDDSDDDGAINANVSISREADSAQDNTNRNQREGGEEQARN